MKLLCVSPTYWPAYRFGGPIQSVHNLMKSLAGEGVDVTVYTTSHGLGDEVETDTELELDGLRITYFRHSGLLDFLGTTGWNFSVPMTRALAENVCDFDLVYILGVWNYPTAAAGHYARSVGVPYIVSPRGQLYPYAALNKSWKKIPYYKLVARRDLCGASAIHYTSLDEQKRCHSYLGFTNPSIVIPNGIDVRAFAPQGRKTLKDRMPWLGESKVLLALSRLTGKKGFDTLVRAFRLLLDERDDVHLLIVGNDEGGYKSQIHKMLKSAGIPYADIELERGGVDAKTIDPSVRVTFTGFLSDELKKAAYATSDIYVLPSYSENFGMTVVEAMSMGLPVVISDQVGICMEVKSAEAGLVVVPEPEHVHKALKTILESEKLRKQFSRSARVLAASFDSSRVSRLAVEELTKLAGVEG